MSAVVKTDGRSVSTLLSNRGRAEEFFRVCHLIDSPIDQVFSFRMYAHARDVMVLHNNQITLAALQNTDIAMLSLNFPRIKEIATISFMSMWSVDFCLILKGVV